MARIKPRLLKGFRDYLPPIMVPRTRILRKIASVFERYGFEPLDTPSIEYSEILLGKAGPEAEKLFYRFDDQGGRDVALRYELTISLARVIAQYKTDLPRPFKRYQMGPVWRAESPAKGRFREFWQCDVDIIGSTSPIADAECLAIDFEVMRACGVQNYRIRFNNRKLFRGLQAVIGVSDDDVMAGVMRAVDKHDKIGDDGVRAELDKLLNQGGFSESGRDKVMQFLELQGDTNDETLTALEGFLGTTNVGTKGLAELREVYTTAIQLGVDPEVLEIDPRIVRGLDYYTGTVFETFLQDAPKFGSVMSGGRYDGLIGIFAGEEIPAVGISVGIDRLLAALEELGLLPDVTSSAGVLVTIFDESMRDFSVDVATTLRKAGVKTELYLDVAKLNKQMKYASKKGIPMVAIAGPEEANEGVVSLRNMVTGDQERVKLENLAQAIQDNYVDPDPNARGQSWDWEFTDEMIDRVPDVGGVFLLRGEGRVTLYAGWGGNPNLRETIRNAVTSDQGERVKTFDWYEIRDDKLSEAMAEFIAAKLKPEFNQ